MACRSSDERAHGWSDGFNKRINMLVGRYKDVRGLRNKRKELANKK